MWTNRRVVSCAALLSLMAGMAVLGCRGDAGSTDDKLIEETIRAYASRGRFAGPWLPPHEIVPTQCEKLAQRFDELVGQNASASDAVKGAIGEARDLFIEAAGKYRSAMKNSSAADQAAGDSLTQQGLEKLQELPGAQAVFDKIEEERGVAAE